MKRLSHPVGSLFFTIQLAPDSALNFVTACSSGFHICVIFVSHGGRMVVTWWSHGGRNWLSLVPMYAKLMSACFTYSNAQGLWETCSTPILKQVKSDFTRYCYGDEQHLDEI